MSQPGSDPDSLSGDRIRKALRRLRNHRKPSTGGTSDVRSILDAIAANTKSHVDREPAAADADDSVTKDTPKYRIDQEIGAGGVGVVYRGRDAYLGREVALKFLNDRFKGNEQVVARFLEEAQIGGQLQHPGIVPVLDIGVSEGQLFFAMKMVKGRAFSAFLGNRPPESLTQARLLKIFEAVCQTIAYAHARGVIHRDLKPDNVMVGEFGEVQVVDWGMAKVLGTVTRTDTPPVDTVRSTGADGGDAQTMVGAVLGTPDYMPPEQARGDRDAMDARSDVFALGAILLEILTGQAPYTGPALDDRLAQARAAELGPALDRLAAAHPDAALDALCRACLAADPDSRPKAAGEVARGIQEYLSAVEERAQQARVEAAQAETRAQGERQARRLTTALAVAVVAVVLLVTGGWAFLTWQATERRGQTEAAIQTKLEAAADARREADWARAIGAIDAARFLARSGAASTALATRTLALHTTLHAEAAADARRRTRAARHERLLAALDLLPYPEKEVTSVADWRLLFERTQQAFAAVELELLQQPEPAAIDAAREHGAPEELAAALGNWALTARYAQRPAHMRRLLAIANAIDPQADRVAFRALLEKHDMARVRRLVQAPKFREAGSGTVEFAGRLLLLDGVQQDTESRTVALEAYRHGLRRHPSSFALTLGMARALFWQRPPRAQEAARHYQAALAMRPGGVELHHEYGRLLDQELRESAHALQHFRICVEKQPTNAHYWWHLALAHQHLGNHTEAIRACRTAEEIDQNDITNRLTLAQSLRRAGRPADAIPVLEKVEAEAPDNGAAWSIHGLALMDLEKHEAAIPVLEKALPLGADSPTHNNYGLTLQRLGRFADAAKAFRQALEIDANNHEARCNLAYVLVDLNRVDESIATFREALRRAPHHARSHLNLGGTLLSQDQFHLAVHHLREGWRLGGKAPAPRAVADFLRQRAGKLASDGKKDLQAIATQLATEIEKDL